MMEKQRNRREKTRQLPNLGLKAREVGLPVLAEPRDAPGTGGALYLLLLNTIWHPRTIGLHFIEYDYWHSPKPFISFIFFFLTLT